MYQTELNSREFHFIDNKTEQEKQKLEEQK